MSCDTCKDKPQYPKAEKTYIKCAVCDRDLAGPSQRTNQQNKSIHKWADELATELNNHGLDMKAVLKPDVDIPWDKDSVKRFIIHPIMEAMIKKTSTKDLTTAEVSKVVDVINRHLLDKFKLSLPFPSIESRYDV